MLNCTALWYTPPYDTQVAYPAHKDDVEIMLRSVRGNSFRDMYLSNRVVNAIRSTTCWLTIGQQTNDERAGGALTDDSKFSFWWKLFREDLAASKKASFRRIRLHRRRSFSSVYLLCRQTFSYFFLLYDLSAADFPSTRSWNIASFLPTCYFLPVQPINGIPMEFD